MTVVTKNAIGYDYLVRDARPMGKRIADFLGKTEHAGMTLLIMGGGIAFADGVAMMAEAVFLVGLLYIRWITKRSFKLSFKMPAYAGTKMRDPNNPPPGRGGAGKCEGILYLGTDVEEGTELWLTNNDARTHILYLGTTGAGKTEGLKSLVTNALCWGSGFVYTDGKADTDLWASLFALSRRFGRDDDLLILNYMTGNSDEAAVSNTMNPFSNGSSSYLTNMVVSLMPDAGGDNAMWKERAVALMGALMPAMTWKRDKQGFLLDVSVVREHLELGPIIRLSRDPNLPERIIRGLQGYLATLPGFVDEAFDDEGNEKPPSPDQPMYDLQVARQQHGYLSMQFTRALQSLGDEYGYIFKAQLADIDVLDVVLNRRILVVLIPALEKSSDEAANLGKIVAACLKGMMGATLGNTVQGSWESAIESKQTRSASSFMTVFDEVGYYTSQGMAVMAAQARSLGFSLVFASQDLPSMEKRIKQEARSILGNCNLKIFGKLEDPTDTKEFLEKHAGDDWVVETKGFTAPSNTLGSMFMDTAMLDDRGAGMSNRKRVSYDHLRKQKEGEAYMFFGHHLVQTRMFHAAPEKVKALRVHKMLPVPGTNAATGARDRAMHELSDNMKDKGWKAAEAAAPAATTPEIAAMSIGYDAAVSSGASPTAAGAAAVASVAEGTASAGKPVSAGSNPVLASATASPLTGGMGSVAVVNAPPTATSAATTSQQAGRKGNGNNHGLRPGDEDAITEIVREAPLASATASPAATAPATNRRLGAATAGSDIYNVVTRPASDTTEIRESDLQLPAEIASILQQTADKFTKGMFVNRRRGE